MGEGRNVIRCISLFIISILVIVAVVIPVLNEEKEEEYKTMPSSSVQYIMEGKCCFFWRI